MGKDNETDISKKRKKSVNNNSGGGSNGTPKDTITDMYKVLYFIFFKKKTNKFNVNNNINLPFL